MTAFCSNETFAIIVNGDFGLCFERAVLTGAAHVVVLMSAVFCLYHYRHHKGNLPKHGRDSLTNPSGMVE